ncbi:MAG: hypothetical protein KJ069_21565 [Anaerolineae bacterium]|nr:hypothetical protein [Anaerolineae bacterium]
MPKAFAQRNQTVHHVTAVHPPSISPLPIVCLVYGRAKTIRCSVPYGHPPHHRTKKGTAVTANGRTAKFVSHYNSLLPLPHPIVIAVPYLGNSGEIAVNFASV